MKRLILGAAAALLGSTTAAWPSVEISTAPTSNMVCAAGVCAPSAKRAVLNANDLAAMLATADVKVVTGNGAVTITVASPLSWTSARRLTLDANLDVSFRAPVVVAGPGAVTIVTNDGGSGGQLIFFEAGKLDFWSLTSSLVINGSSYVLVGDVATLAADIASFPAGTFALAKDYDASPDRRYKGAAIVTPLDGVFDGLGHTIYSLKIGQHSCDGSSLGLFSLIDQSGTVRDLHLDHVNVSSGRPQTAGGIAGGSLGAIANVWVSGSIKTASGSGGKCQGAGAGGVVGGSGFTGSIFNAHSSARVTMTLLNKYSFSSAGGLAGSASHVDLSSSTGNVDAPGASIAGGLLGAGDTVSRSFTTSGGDAGTGGFDAGSGGLVGQGGNISNSYALGGAGGSVGCTGGFVGNNLGNITSSYSTGPVYGDIKGGFSGCIYSSPDSNDYWDTDTSGTTTGCGNDTDCTGVTGLTDDQLKSALPAGFDRTIWARDKNINNGYPYLIDNPPQ